MTTANCEICGSPLLIVLDEDEEMELRFVSTDPSGRAIFQIDITVRDQNKPRKK